MGKVKKVIIGVVVTALVGTGIGGGLLYVRKGSQKEVLVAVMATIGNFPFSPGRLLIAAVAS